MSRTLAPTRIITRLTWPFRNFGDEFLQSDAVGNYSRYYVWGANQLGHFTLGCVTTLIVFFYIKLLAYLPNNYEKVLDPTAISLSDIAIIAAVLVLIAFLALMLLFISIRLSQFAYIFRSASQGGGSVPRSAVIAYGLICRLVLIVFCVFLIVVLFLFTVFTFENPTGGFLSFEFPPELFARASMAILATFAIIFINRSTVMTLYASTILLFIIIPMSFVATQIVDKTADIELFQRIVERTTGRGQPEQHEKVKEARLGNLDSTGTVIKVDDNVRSAIKSEQEIENSAIINGSRAATLAMKRDIEQHWNGFWISKSEGELRSFLVMVLSLAFFSAITVAVIAQREISLNATSQRYLALPIITLLTMFILVLTSGALFDLFLSAIIAMRFWLAKEYGNDLPLAIDQLAAARMKRFGFGDDMRKSVINTESRVVREYRQDVLADVRADSWFYVIGVIFGMSVASAMFDLRGASIVDGIFYSIFPAPSFSVMDREAALAIPVICIFVFYLGYTWIGYSWMQRSAALDRIGSVPADRLAMIDFPLAARIDLMAEGEYRQSVVQRHKEIDDLLIGFASGVEIASDGRSEGERKDKGGAIRHMIIAGDTHGLPRRLASALASEAALCQLPPFASGRRADEPPETVRYLPHDAIPQALNAKSGFNFGVLIVDPVSVHDVDRLLDLGLLDTLDGSKSRIVWVLESRVRNPSASHSNGNVTEPFDVLEVRQLLQKRLRSGLGNCATLYTYDVN